MKQIDIRGVIVSDDDLWIYDWFGMTATSPGSVRAILNEAAGEDIEVIINSSGGDVMAGDEIFTLLRGYTGKVIIKIHSLAASAAAVIAMAGESEMSPVAQLMIHNVSSRTQGDNRDMAHMATVLENANRAIAAAFVAKTGKSEAEILDLMAKETWFTAEQAVKEGFVDRVMFADNQVPAQPLRLAAAYGGDLLPQNVIEYAKKHFNNKKTLAVANANYQFLLLEGKINE